MTLTEIRMKKRFVKNNLAFALAGSAGVIEDSILFQFRPKALSGFYCVFDGAIKFLMSELKNVFNPT